MNILTAILTIMLAYEASISNEYGRIGVRMWHGRVYHVYSHSPAREFGIKEGDIIIEADHKKGDELVTGAAGIPVDLKIKRGDFTIELVIPRVPKSEVYDTAGAK